MSELLKSFCMRKASEIIEQNNSANPNVIENYYRKVYQGLNKASQYLNELPTNSLERQILNNSFPNSKT
jgi:hypothetical protein